MKEIKKSEIIMAVIIGGVCIVLFAIMFMQFKTVEETDITAIANMREAELRTAIAEWKGKYEEALEQLKTNQKSILEYQEKLEKEEETSDLVDKDLEESNMKLGKVTVYGEGIELTVADGERAVEPIDLIDLISELRYAGAEAISINDIRILSTGYVSQPQEGLTVISGQRATSPFVVKAIGNPTYLSSTLSLKDSGYIDRCRLVYGLSVSDIEIKKNVEIVKDNSDRETKYIKKGEE